MNRQDLKKTLSNSPKETTGNDSIKTNSRITISLCYVGPVLQISPYSSGKRLLYSRFYFGSSFLHAAKVTPELFLNDIQKAIMQSLGLRKHRPLIEIKPQIPKYFMNKLNRSTVHSCSFNKYKTHTLPQTSQSQTHHYKRFISIITRASFFHLGEASRDIA